MNTIKLFILCIGVFFFSACSKSDGGEDVPQVDLPTVKIGDAVIEREKTEGICRFYVNLSASFNKKVSVKYNTTEGSAKSKTDFKAQSGTVTFLAGETELTIDIPIVGDSLRQPKQEFYVQLSNPANCTLGVSKGTGTIVNNGTYLPTDSTGYATPKTYTGYHLVWSDEFDEKALNENFWNYETGTGSNGWGNNELEYYTSRPENVFL